MVKNILKHNFTEPKDEPTIIGGGSQYSTISSRYSTLTGGRNNTISTSDYTFIGSGNNNTISTYYGNSFIGGGHNNTVGETIISRDPIGTEEFRASAVFTSDMAHTMPREEITTHLKRQIMAEVFENMVRSDMFEFWTNMNPASFGEQINCRLKVVRPQN
jgi:hypothetical protein